MTAKERVLTALQHKEADRVPFMYRDVPEVRQRLKKDLKLKTDEELFQYLDIDFRWVQPKYIGPKLKISADRQRDIWGVEWKYTKFSDSAGYWNEVSHPLAEISNPKQLDDYQWATTEWWNFSEVKNSVVISPCVGLG